MLVGHHELDASAGEAGALAAELAHLLSEALGGADGFELDEVAMRAALFFDVAEGRDAAVLQDQNFVAGLIDVAQQVRGDQQADAAFLANLLDGWIMRWRAMGSRPLVGSSRISSRGPCASAWASLMSCFMPSE